MIFSPIFKKNFIAIRLKWYYIKLQEEFIFCRRSSFFNGFFSEEGNKPDRSRLEKTEKTHTPKDTKKLRSFFGFSELC